MFKNNQSELSDMPLPEQHNCLGIAFNLQTAEQFCQNLPTHDIAETATLLFKFFSCFNLHHIDNITRYQINQLLNIKIDYVFDNLFKQFLSLSNQDLNLQQSILILIENLFTLSKQSHQIVIEELIDKLFFNKDMLTTSIACCLRLNLKCLFAYFFVYAKTPKNLWLSCHTLYQLAEKKNLTNRSFSSIDKEIMNSSISDWYKHILLFSIANPYRLCTQELLLLYHALPYWTKYIKIIPFDDAQNELFSLELTKDSPPVYISLNLCPISKSSRVLELKKLTAYLDALLSTHHTGSPTEKNLPSSLIKQLIATWSYFSNRGQDRVEINQPAKAFSGLNGVIQALSTQKESSFSFLSDCMIINESPGGFCIEFEVNSIKSKQPQTGDLLGLSNQTNTHQQQITIGVIRWVKQLDTKKIQCGLQLIGHHPQTLNIQIIGENESDLIGEPQQVLFIPEMAAFGRGESIVSPGMPFKTGMKIKLLADGSHTTGLSTDKPVELSDLVLSTGNFKQFFIQPQS